MDDVTLSKPDAYRGLIFQVANQRYEIDSGSVIEVMRPPPLTRVPHGPKALKGIANFRGRPLPVLSVSAILNDSEQAAQRDGKIIVYEHQGAIGLFVDDVLRFSTDQTASVLEGLNERIDTAFKTVRREPKHRVDHRDHDTVEQATIDLKPFLSFRVAGQLCGLALRDVREVSTWVGDTTTAQNDADAVLGLIPMRDRTVPLISLARLMGVNERQATRERSNIVVVEHQGDLIGLVVDEIDLIFRLPEDAIDAVPAVLQKRSGTAQIEAFGRIAEKGLLMSILSPEKLFGHEAVTQAIDQNHGAERVAATTHKDNTTEQFVIFRLGEEDYGLPIGSVDEVIRVPRDVTRMPGAPAFVMGVINLRGAAIPLIDQHSRFEAQAPKETSKARAVVVTLGNLKAAFVVDSVSEVKGVPVAAVIAAPEFSTNETNVFDRVARIDDDDGRMILLIDPQELLTRAERDVLAAISQEKTVVSNP